MVSHDNDNRFPLNDNAFPDNGNDRGRNSLFLVLQTLEMVTNSLLGGAGNPNTSHWFHGENAVAKPGLRAEFSQVPC